MTVSPRQSSKVLITVPLRALLDQFTPDFPGFCKVGTGHNDNIDYRASGFISVTRSVDLLENLTFDTILVDEAHHPLPLGLPNCTNLFRFSATLGDDADFQYNLSQAIEDGVLCDYDITVPATTQHHAYVGLADLLLKQAGRFRRVLAYCNTIAEAKKFQMVLWELGLAAWHINAGTNQKKRRKVLDEFTGPLQKPVHILVTVEVLGEGINIPNADTCMFVEPRGSYRSIVQAIGRVLRHDPQKTIAHIVLPAFAVPTSQPHQATPTSSKLVETAQCGQEHSNLGAPRHPSFSLGFESKSDVNIVNKTLSTVIDFGQDARPNLPAKAQPDSQARSTFKVAAGGQHSSGTSFANGYGCLPQTEPSILEHCGAESFSKFDSGLCLGLPGSFAGKNLAEGREMPNSKQRELVRYAAGQGPQRTLLVKSDCSRAPGQPAAMRSRKLRAGRLKFQRQKGVLDGNLYGSQLERFLSTLLLADHRLAGTNAAHRIQVVDCRTGLDCEIGRDRLQEIVYGKLTAILYSSDGWDFRLRQVEEFVKVHGRLPLPRQSSNNERDVGEFLLGNWLKAQGYFYQSGQLQVHRWQKLLSTSCDLIRSRVDMWISGGVHEALFQQRCSELKAFIETHKRLPISNKKRPAENKLAFFLRTMVRNRMKQGTLGSLARNDLREVHPLVAALLQRLCAMPLRICRKKWDKQLTRLTRFVQEHGHLPKFAARQHDMYSWFRLQIRRAGNLPPELVEQMRKAHPLIAGALPDVSKSMPAVLQYLVCYRRALQAYQDPGSYNSTP